ncbi:virulence RhuM family protein [uncultured Dialister sp.]|uniref:virulence RhuM family protein n=1 Tax=uncultured Dialister sp. TaxID=278064 RepID=UPI002598BBE1|nr:virulence RhuM family protein [uncultured Dialister sp.]
MDNFIIYNTDDGQAKVSLLAKDGTVWCTQAQMAELFNVQRAAISKHLKNLFEDGEVDKNSVVSILETTAADGKKYKVAFYSLDSILAVGFRVRSPRGTQFRRWANSTLKEYLQKGFVLDSERLKNPDGRPDYFDELLEKIRDIRASEKRFYQKLRDLFALSSDYSKTDRSAISFFSEVQNKLIYGVTGRTAAELILDRADAAKPNMALTSWQGSIVRRKDIYTAKNYLTADELDSLNRLVTIFLESAEFRVKLRKDLTLSFWREETDRLLTSYGIPVLASAGTVSHKQMMNHVDAVYSAFDARRKASDAEAADREDLEELEQDAKWLAASKVSNKNNHN